MIYSFGVRKEPCRDCWKIGEEWHCTMNCGPRVESADGAEKSDGGKGDGPSHRHGKRRKNRVP